jgi:hypothetical protein
VAEGKLTFAIKDTRTRGSLVTLMKWCLQHAAGDRPDMEGVLACLDDIRNKRGVPESEEAMRARYGVSTGRGESGDLVRRECV